MSDSQSATRLIFVMCAAEVLGMAGVFAFPALLPQFFLEWGLTNTEAGWINGIYYAGYTVSVPVLASLTDRVDARRVYLASGVVATVAALGFALFANGFWWALLFRVLGGLGLAGTFIPGLKVLVDRLHGTWQARAVAIYTATFGIGTSLSFFSAGELGARFGWRWAFGLATLSTVVALILAATWVRARPPESKMVPDTRLLDFRPVFRNIKAMSYVLAYTAHMWELFAVRSWMVAFLAFSLSLQPTARGTWSPSTVVAVATLVAVGANVCGAELAIRFGRRRLLSMIMWTSALFALFIGFTAKLPYPALSILCVIYTMFVTADSGAIHTGAVLNAEPERRGATMAIQSLLGFASASVSPLVVGVVLDATGGGQSVVSWGAAFITMGLVVASGPIILLLMQRKTE